MPYAPDSYPRQIPQFKVHGRGEVTVSAKGIVTGDSNIPNDGADFGPDTMLGATVPGQYGAPYTQTSGIQEAYQYATTSGRSLDIDSGIFPLNQQLFFTAGNIHIHGRGFSTVLKATSTITKNPNSTVGATLEISNTIDNFSLHNMIIDNSNAPSTLQNIGGGGTYTNFTIHDIELIAPTGNSGNGGILFEQVSQTSASYNFEIYNIYSPNGASVSTYSYPSFDGPSFYNFAIHDIYINVTAPSLGDDRISINLNNNSVTTGTYMHAFNFYIYNIYIYVASSTGASSKIDGMSVDVVTTATNGIATWMHDFEIRNFYLFVDPSLTLDSGEAIHFDGSTNFYNYTIDTFHVTNMPNAGYIRFNTGFDYPQVIVSNISLYNVSNGLIIAAGMTPSTIPATTVSVTNYKANGTNTASSTGLTFQSGGIAQGWNGASLKNILIENYSTSITNQSTAWSGIGIDGITTDQLPNMISGTFSIKNSTIQFTPTLSANPPVTATVYQNTNPFDIEIDLPVYATTAGTAGYVTIAKGATSSPTAIGNQYVNGATSSTSVDIIKLRVPAGWYYSFTASGVTFGTASVFAD